MTKHTTHSHTQPHVWIYATRDGLELCFCDHTHLCIKLVFVAISPATRYATIFSRLCACVRFFRYFLLSIDSIVCTCISLASSCADITDYYVRVWYGPLRFEIWDLLLNWHTPTKWTKWDRIALVNGSSRSYNDENRNNSKNKQASPNNQFFFLVAFFFSFSLFHWDRNAHLVCAQLKR